MSSPTETQRALWKKAKHSSVLLTPRFPIHDNRHRHPNSQHDETSPLLETVEVLPQEAKIIESSWRQRLAFHMDISPLNRLWELFDLVLNFLFVCLYIYNTTFDEDGLPYIPYAIDVSLAILLFMQYSPHLYVDVDLRRQWQSPLCWLTFISCVPVIMAFVDPMATNSYMSAGVLAYVYPFRFVRLHVILMRCLVPSKTSILKFSLITRKAIRLIAFLLFLILTVAAFVHIVALKSHNVKKLTFFDSFFFAFISATSGTSYQLIPDSVFSRIVILYIMVTAVIFIPTRLAELLRLVGMKSVYDHSFKHKNNQNHVVVCGEFEINSLFAFLKEFFCADHGAVTVNTHVVILNPQEPTEELKLILDDPLYVNRVQYVKGSVMQLRSMEKIRIKEAKACFIFSSKFTTQNAADDDAKTVMRALALKKYVSHLKLHVQVLLPEHKCHFDYLADSMICIDELKLGMLAQNCRCPGLTTLLHILTTSLTEKAARGIMSKTRMSSNSWVDEYVQGASQEIYPIQVSVAWAGQRFSQLSYSVFRHYGVAIFALGIPNKSYHQKQAQKASMKDQLDELDHVQRESLEINSSDYSLYINPSGYVLKGNEICFYIGGTQMILDKVLVNDTFAHEVRDFTPEHINVDITADKSFDDDDVTPTESKDGQLLGSAIKQAGGLETLPEVIFDETEQVAEELVRKQLEEPLKGANADLSVDTAEKEKNTFVSRILQQAMGFGNNQPLFSGGTERPTSAFTSSSIDTLAGGVIPEDVSGHILVCDPNGSPNIEYFIAPLRSRHLQSNATTTSMFRKDVKQWTPIVLLTPRLPSVSQLKMLEKFEEIYVIQGNPIQRKDLYRAGVQRCLKAVVLANSIKGKVEAERTADASSLLCVLNIEALCQEQELFIITEFVHSENQNFIGESTVPYKKGTAEYSRTLMRPSFMAGHTYSQDMLDSVICQQFYNNHMLSILRHIIFSGTFHLQNRLNDDNNEPDHSHIWLIKLPDAVQGTKYLDLYNLLVYQQNAIPIGLYRQVPVQPKNEPAPQDTSNGNRSFMGFRKSSAGYTAFNDSGGHHYVCVNPAPDTLLRKEDCVYVFSVERPVLSK